MAPNVWGEKQTLRQMLLYTGILLPMTLAPVMVGDLGYVYGVAATVLGLWLLYGVIKVVRAKDFTVPAWALYRSSLLYLALLFAAVLVDGLVPNSFSKPAVEEPFLLQNPDVQLGLEAGL
jgi:protoheme IX farnesyltransferase